MFRKIVLALLVVIAVAAVFAAVVALQPSEYRLSRSTAIAAPPPNVFVQVNNFRNWEKWSPWAKRIPQRRSSSCCKVPYAAASCPNISTSNALRFSGRFNPIKKRWPRFSVVIFSSLIASPFRNRINQVGSNRFSGLTLDG